MAERNRMTVSPRWLKAAVDTFVFGFAVLGYLAARIISGSPPIPEKVVDPAGRAMLWSVLSLVGLLGGTGLVLFVFGRYKHLGWHTSRNRPGGPSGLPRRSF